MEFARLRVNDVSCSGKQRRVLMYADAQTIQPGSLMMHLRVIQKCFKRRGEGGRILTVWERVFEEHT